MRSLKLALCMSCLAIVACSGLGRASSVADPPATAPATQPADDPRAALKAYNAAMALEDVDGMMKQIYAPGDADLRLAKSMSRSDMYVSKLLKATREKFGDAAATKLGAAVNDASDAIVDVSTFTVTGDHGKISFPGGGYTSMIRHEGRWKIDAPAMIEQSGGQPEILMERISQVGNRAKVLAQEVAAGQFTSVEQVIARLNQKEEDSSKK